ncbi:hypothetical protein [Staphylococcus epidermidis]|nr:hypothetical protein [Staphylococcus epidermidis]
MEELKEDLKEDGIEVEGVRGKRIRYGELGEDKKVGGGKVGED